MIAVTNGGWKKLEVYEAIVLSDKQNMYWPMKGFTQGIFYCYLNMLFEYFLLFDDDVGVVHWQTCCFYITTSRFAGIKEFSELKGC